MQGGIGGGGVELVQQGPAGGISISILFVLFYNYIV